MGSLTIQNLVIPHLHSISRLIPERWISIWPSKSTARERTSRDAGLITVPLFSSK